MDIHRSHRWRRRILTALGLLAVIGALGYTGYVGVVGSDTIIHPERSADCRTPLVRYGWPYEAINYDRAADDGLTPTQTPSDSGRLRWTCDGVPAPAGDMVTASDGTRIAGWYIPAASAIGPTGPTLVLVHGNSSNKSEYQRYAVPLHDAFNIVVIDLRNSGQSQVADTTLGVREQLDVRAMVDWLVETKQPTWIGLVGTSIGGAAVLAAAVGDERVDAVILDSTHARIGDVIGNLLAHDKGHPAWPGSLAILIGTRLRTGIDPGAADPVDHIGRLGTRPVLLVHGSADPYDPPAQSADRNLAAAQAAGVDATLRVCDGAGHDAVIDDCPADWATWVRAFLEPLVPVAALP